MCYFFQFCANVQYQKLYSKYFKIDEFDNIEEAADKGSIDWELL